MKFNFFGRKFILTSGKWFFLLLLVSVLFIGILNVISFSSQQSMGNEIVPIQQVTIHRPSLFIERDLIKALPDGVTLVASPPEDISLLADAYRKGLQHEDNLELLSGTFSILAVGPLLDSPDRVKVREISRKENSIKLELNYTKVRTMGVQLRRNVIWRPLVQVSLKLDPGQYQLQVTWHALKSLPKGEPLDLLPITKEVSFSIL